MHGRAIYTSSFNSCVSQLLTRLRFHSQSDANYATECPTIEITHPAGTEDCNIAV